MSKSSGAAGKGPNLLIHGIFLATVVGLLASGSFFIASWRQYSYSSRWVGHSLATISSIESLGLEVESMESNMKWYLLFADPAFAAKFEENIRNIQLSHARALELVSDNPQQLGRLRDMHETLREKIATLEGAVRMFRARGLASAVGYLRSSRAGLLLSKLRSDFQAVQQEERRLLASRQDETQANAKRVAWFGASIFVVSFFAALAAWFFSVRELRARYLSNLGLEAARREADKALSARSAFLANMSHEIRTPLHSIVGMAEVLSGTPTGEESRTCTTVIRRASQALLTLVDDILDLSKIEAGGLELERVPFSVQRVVEDSASIISFRASQKGLSLEFQVEPEVRGTLEGDPNRLRQILLNLVGNAIKFTEKGKIAVQVAVSGINAEQQILLFTVKDSGIGISPGQAKRIFRSFGQADAAIARRYGGSGLGLTISSQLVSMMGGRIWFESQPGAGSTFFAEIPFFVTRQELQEQPANGAAKDARALHLLVVDDVQDNRLLIQMYLKDQPYRLEFAQDGAEAVERCRRGQYDLVLLDMHMPGMTGGEAAHEIRAIEAKERRPAVPILFLSADVTAEQVQAKPLAGPVRYVTKPVVKNALLRVIGEITRDASPNPPEDETVRISWDLKTLIPAFLENRKVEVREMGLALDSGDFAALESIAHSFVGVTGSYGFAELSRSGRDLQKAAQRHDAAAARVVLESCALRLQNVKISYD